VHQCLFKSIQWFDDVALESPSQNSLQNPSAPHQRIRSVVRHTASHVMAMAVQKLFLSASYHWPLENGFTTTLTIQSHLQKGSESHPERDGQDYQSETGVREEVSREEGGSRKLMSLTN